jgi:hypothetical protein
LIWNICDNFSKVFEFGSLFIKSEKTLYDNLTSSSHYGNTLNIHDEKSADPENVQFMKKHQPDLYRARRIETYRVFASNKKSLCLADKNIKDNLNVPGKT